MQLFFILHGDYKMTVAISKGLIMSVDRSMTIAGRNKRSLGQVDQTRGATDINLNERTAPLTIHRVI